MARATQASGAIPTDSGKGENLTFDDFPGLKQFRDYMVRAPGDFCIERALLRTRFLKQHGMDYTDPFTRQAESLKHVLENKKPCIYPGDLLAGSSTSKRKGVLFYPEFISGLGIMPELLSMQVRSQNPYHLSEDEVMILDSEVFPFWMDKNVGELLRQRLGDADESYRLHQQLFMFMASKFNCQSHTIPDYGRVLEHGLEGLVSIARQKLESDEVGPEKQRLYEGMITVMEGVMVYADHLSREATRQARSTMASKRRKQLERMAVINEKVPAKPATTFWEAVQSIWTCMNALYQEQANVGFSIGRIDQLLQPYYQHDIERGIITRKEAFEILAHLWLKICDNLPLVPEAGEMLFGGTGSNQAITIGGSDPSGNNAVNDVSMLCLDVVNLLQVRDPNLNARVRQDDPPAYTHRLAEVIINTGATPSLVSDTAVIPALQKLGISLPDARDYAQVGCLEPTSTGRTFGHTGAILLNVMAALELAGGNGNSRRLEGIGLRTGRLDSFDTFEDFFNAVKQQLDFIIRHATRLNNELGQVWRYLHPQPLLSALFEGPMEHGKSLLDGGATYNSSGIAFIALADLIDSLHAIRQLVFIEKRFTLEQLVNITNDNFKGHEKLHSKVVHKIKHFGNGIEEIDDIGQEIVDFIYKVSTGIKNYRGGPYSPGYWSMTIHSGFGKITGAYPHGKLKGDNFASGLTPVSFGQQQGPTGVFNSLAHLDSSKMPNGMALNMKFSKNMFNSPGKVDIFISLFKAYFKKGGMQVQFTIHDPKILVEARDNPGKYPDLMVRISGYTAYFNDLNEQMKKEIIERALMDL